MGGGRVQREIVPNSLYSLLFYFELFPYVFEPAQVNGMLANPNPFGQLKYYSSTGTNDYAHRNTVGSNKQTMFTKNQNMQNEALRLYAIIQTLVNAGTAINTITSTYDYSKFYILERVQYQYFHCLDFRSTSQPHVLGSSKSEVWTYVH